MVSHTYHIHLDSATIQLPDVDDLLGKDVEVTIREVSPADGNSNFDAINHLLQQASPAFFKTITNPVDWQKQIRDEWE